MGAIEARRNVIAPERGYPELPVAPAAGGALGRSIILRASRRSNSTLTR